MSTSHRPSDETLAAFAAGQLDEGLALVVACHVEAEPESRRRLRELQAISGALLDAIEPVALTSGLPDIGAVTRDAPLTASVTLARDAGLPRVLRPYGLGPWRPVGVRIAMRRVEVPGAESRVFMLRGGPGIALPHHKHSGLEWTTILNGAYTHEYGRYAAGDFDEAQSEHEHTPRVDPAEGCTCIVALTGKVILQGWLGRLLQPLVRF
ncbi:MULTISPECIES: ChrR family anti-sigma-E factor [unclassified Chelatococcus]|uniref:ChrR family anti-sigma-E factor n=1 Tax=unclassified Chelatococcus TaxID=2638111 RepID=UPI001BD102F0|nr:MULTISPECIES: ChrR family anti-sigma-E factor [unclassified Chelatococcus]CAH1655774.1 ChrR-like anti-ECFsigma factor [Hyphomicrobiales bacterium]MBS7742558.1 ChrR family anti-sigma-E factor [Chelatococcus sp. HY11]MBX3542324.1 ChrR family anti-sigma-E factor [Chelatococcus sp.]MCO5075458.1 ChrR family anti-sigma-E factor [Chelatococcus sp.]CAH1695631.1 ChrR-like anti-ECFsigma factor [Hyphomicrobiales bacterium]